jgi:hypothetical protein
MEIDFPKLYAYYQATILPRYGITDRDIHWHGSQQVGPDEAFSYFSAGGHDYALIYVDASSEASMPSWLETYMRLSPGTYAYVNLSQPEEGRAYPTPNLHVPWSEAAMGMDFGVFTLIELFNGARADPWDIEDYHTWMNYTPPKALGDEPHSQYAP